MTDDELRLAAGEILADLTRPGGGPQWTYRGRKTWDIIRDVLAAFVAECPADDGPTLDGLLSHVESLFGPSRSACYQFHLGRVAGAWRFEVVDAWPKWLERRLQYQFAAPTAAGAAAAFLDYVRVHGIDVRELTEGG